MFPFYFQFDDQSDISKRIEAWHASIQEKLKIAERRRAFDLKVYSKDVLDAFNGDSIKNFGSVLKDKPSTDVARYFLTTLMLVIFFFNYFYVKSLDAF